VESFSFSIEAVTTIFVKAALVLFNMPVS
jgi:hypothetical protein